MNECKQLGWATSQDSLCIKQGAQGSVELRLTVEQDDGTPLPSYANFTAKFKLFTQASKLVQEFNLSNGCLSIASSPTEKLVIVTLLFKPEFTSLYPAGQKLLGDLKVTLPNGTEHQYPYEISLVVLRSLTL